MTTIKVKPSERLVKLTKAQILETYKFWQESSPMTEVEHYYEDRLRMQVEKLLSLVPDYTDDLRTGNISELIFKIRKDLGKSPNGKPTYIDTCPEDRCPICWYNGMDSLKAEGGDFCEEHKQEF